MPNWCSNSITISSNKENIDKFEAFLNEKNGKEWFDFFYPCPEELTDVDSPNRDDNQSQQLIEKYGHADWYSWCVENWGTKWNTDAQDWSREGETISFWFDSAWSPPTNLYEKLTNENGEYNIEAYYLEEGMGFVGKFCDGYDDYYEYTDSESLNDIPEDIVDNWNLRENLEEWEAENADEEEWSEERMDVVGSNGNDGLHYDEVEEDKKDE